MKKRIINFLVLLILALNNQSCFSPSYSKLNFNGSGSFQTGGDSSQPPGAGGESATNNNTVGNLPPQIDVINFVDPYTGTSKPKIALNKNFGGWLYLYTINAAALDSLIVKVKFFIGKDRQEVDLDGTIATTSGLTPQVPMQLIAVNMLSKPFNQLRLFYDLYDYNTYTPNATGTSIPTQDPKNSGLYCRGLNIQDDPTFLASTSKTTCNAANDICYYTYAKIRDVGLFDPNGFPTIPVSPLVNIGSLDFSNLLTDSTQIAKKNSLVLNKCLPDNGKVYFKDESNFKQLTYTAGNTTTAALGQNALTVYNSTTGNNDDYSFNGPYQAINQKNWGIQGDAIFGASGIFASYMGSVADPTKGIYSRLFPLAAKLSLSGQNRTVIASSNAFKSASSPVVGEDRTIQTVPLGGATPWMDGCNFRKNNFDAELLNEGIQSCNVTATMEIWTTDPQTLNKQMVFSTNRLKIQFISPSIIDPNGHEVLFQAFKTCQNSNACDQNECCFNSRCWSKDSVSRCMEDATVEGNKLVGDTCTSDFDCISFCCDSSIGKCAAHNPNLPNPIYCSKPPGSQCITKEWCRQDPVNVCKVIKTGTNENGKQTCALRCFVQDTFGDCVNGICVPPAQPAAPQYDSATFDCSTAEEPPTT